MSLISLAFEVADQIEKRGLPVSPVVVVVPAVDADEAFGDESYGYAEGQSFIIEYVDSAGKPSTRPITVYSIEAGSGGVPVLKARCHVRKNTRAFRIDRIKCCIDFDGEVFDEVPVFLVDNFGMHPAFASMKGDFSHRKQWCDVLDIVRNDALILAAIGRSDGDLHADESEAILQHLSKLAERNGVFLNGPETLALLRYANRLRPGYERVLLALRGLASEGADHVQRLLRTCVTVMDADGKRHPEEKRLLSAISEELSGVALND